MIIKNIQDRIATKGPGWIFSAMDFTDLSNRNAIDQTLLRLSQKGIIRKLTTGLYDTPIVNHLFGPIPPDPDKVADAIAKKYGYQIQVTPAKAANTLGLSLQIPAQIIYLTDGFSKVVKIGNQTLKFIHVSHKKLLGIGTTAGLIIQALYYFGKSRIDDTSLIIRIRSLLRDTDKKSLRTLLPQTPIWMHHTLKKIIQDA